MSESGWDASRRLPWFAGRCSTADVEILLEIGEKKRFRKIEQTWEDSCSKRLGLTRGYVDWAVSTHSYSPDFWRFSSPRTCSVNRPRSRGRRRAWPLSRYIASVQLPNAFTEYGPVAVLIEASLPGLYKQGAVLAIRQPGESGRSQYHVLQLNGDATVVDEVIVPYVSAQQHVEDAPAMSVALTPANYRFTYVGEVGSGDNAAFVFRIAPKKKRSWLIAGQLWIDTATGAAVLQAGRLVRPPSAGIRRVELVRDTKLQDGNPSCRTTHVAMDTQRLGRGELTITEYRLGIDGSEPPPFPGSVSH